MLNAILIISLCCLPTPCFGVGVAGLIAWACLYLLTNVGNQANEQMAAEIQEGNSGAGCLWMVGTMIMVTLGGLATVAVFFAVAAEMR